MQTFFLEEMHLIENLIMENKQHVENHDYFFND